MTFNGWTNYVTWNVALWIDNDEGLRSIADNCSCYDEFIQAMKECEIICTPDDVDYEDPDVNRHELNNSVFGDC